MTVSWTKRWGYSIKSRWNPWRSPSSLMPWMVCSSHLPPSYSLAFQENLTSDLHCSTSSRCPCIACLLSPASSQPAVFTQSTGSQRLPPHSWLLLEGPGNSERYLSWASAFLVVYSIDNMESFKGCQLYLQTLALHNKTFRPQTPIILLGTKLDMDRYRLVTVQVSQCDAEALASRFGCLFFEVSACLDFLSVQHVFYEAVRRARRGGERGHLVPAVYISEDKALLSVPSFTTPCYKELPAPATAKLVTVKTSRAQSMRRAATLNLLKGFKIF
ncbi:ras-like protein family member 12 isoform X4 [Siniperca chuatsi]|uniref:ras-like protein family member 12 isoform X4 n=1 Tax=Siniperca chuatsi TaxID=119488 RepID=UPI001CE1D93F|nr:ras-like protein family member 12 isoform X4 [Siniperca chuatsi]